MRIQDPRRGFTLIEILIVISIIAILASMVLAGVQIARASAMKAQAQQVVSSLYTSLKHYVQDTGMYPGTSYKDDQNGFPALFVALCGERGKGGGPNAPYMNFREDDVAVYEEDTDTYRKATREEIFDRSVDKYMLDPWGVPFIYRENRSRARKPHMHRPTEADIYSIGPNREDQNGPGYEPEDDEKPDDIGNW